MAQQGINQDIGNFNFDQQADYLKAKDVMGLAAGIPGGSTVSTASGPKKNSLTGALGGAAAGASLGSTLGSVVPGIGNLAGAAGGAGLGALLSFLH
jgi:hypothetical protein